MSKNNALKIIDIQMDALKKNKYNSGIKVAYFFASPNNKDYTGPFSKFKIMVKNDVYKHLLNNLGYQILEYSIKGKFFTALVSVKSKYDNKNHVYEFILSLQNQFDSYSNLKLNNVYRTDSVIKI